MFDNATPRRNPLVDEGRREMIELGVSVRSPLVTTATNDHGQGPQRRASRAMEKNKRS